MMHSTRQPASGFDPLMANRLHHCKVCGTPYDPETFKTLQHLCFSLRGVYPHKPTDNPPEPNLYAWWYFQCNGYEPPPANWPLDRFYVSDEEMANTPVSDMRKRGEEYWRTHTNHAWDTANGNPPAWYYKG
jgi:hypothetical protein